MCYNITFDESQYVPQSYLERTQIKMGNEKVETLVRLVVLLMKKYSAESPASTSCNSNTQQ
jgi:hypothetical protein